MPTSTFYAQASDGQIEGFSNGTAYSTTRAGTSGTRNATPSGIAMYCGQQLNGGQYYIHEAFMNFDTSGIPDNATITGVVLRMRVQQTFFNQGTWSIYVYTYSGWGTTLEATDWVPGANFAGMTLCHDLNNTGLANDTWYDFNESVPNARNAINKTGLSSYVFVSNRIVNGTVPTAYEDVSFYTADNTSPDYRPQLIVTYTIPEVLGSATIVGTSGGTKTGSITAPGQATIAGSAAGTKTGQMVAQAAATLVGTSALNSVVSVTRLLQATVVGAATVVAVPTTAVFGVATLAGSAVIDANGARDIQATAILSGSSSLTATAILVQILRPIADNVADAGDNGGSWSSSSPSGAVLWTELNEVVTDDASYAQTPFGAQQAIYEAQLEPGQLPQGGTVRVIFRARTE